MVPRLTGIPIVFCNQQFFVRYAAGVIACLAWASSAIAQAPGAAASVPTTETPADEKSSRTVSAKDPVEAYLAGAFETALGGFQELQVDRPEDAELDLNVGSSHYQLGDYESAGHSYARAARAQSKEVRSEALYNLGNTAYRASRLNEALDYYAAALDIDPEDEDARHNLEFVRREIERRKEQQQQQQQQNSQDSQDNQDQSQDQQEQNGDGSEQQENKSSDNESPQDEPDQQGTPDSQRDSGGSDEDQDGLTDEQERNAENPTDPSNPDTDGDGRMDGEEDANGNGRVDPNETDPNVPEQHEGERQAQNEASAEPTPARMTPEEAQRFLQALQEKRPKGEQRKSKAASLKQEKDW